MNYRSFTKIESVIYELRDKLEVFDSSVISGVRGLSTGEYDNRSIVEYQNCRYLGELAERCEERGLATDKKSLRSILIGFIMETKTVTEEDFLYNQFEIFEEIYRRILGKNFSILDEILLKKCKSQISGNKKVFELNYDSFTEEQFKESSLEEQTFVILALTSYKPSIDNESNKDDYNNLLDTALRLFSDNHPATLSVVSYVSLSHVYDLVLTLTKSKELKSFSKREKNFYKCIKDIILTDLSDVFVSCNSYKQEEIMVSDWRFKTIELIELSHEVSKYSAVEIDVKKGMTLPAKCRKLGIHFSYHLLNGTVLIDDIKNMTTLYSKQNKEFYPKYLFDYIKMDLTTDPYVYCEMVKELDKVIYARYNLIESLTSNSHLSNFNVIKSKIQEELKALYESKQLDKINFLRNKYVLFDKALVAYSMCSPIGFMINYDVDKPYYYLNSSITRMLIKNNCIDSNLKVNIGGETRQIQTKDADVVLEGAWENGNYSFAIELSRRYQKAYEELLNIFKLDTTRINRSGKSTEDVIKFVLNTVDKSKKEYGLIIDTILTILLRTNNTSKYKSCIKTYFEEISDVYGFSDEDKENLIKELLLDNIDVKNAEFYPDSFLVNNIGIEEAFELLNIDAETKFNIKMKYINKYSESRYIGDFERRCIELLKNSLTEYDLNKIEIQKQKDHILSMIGSYLSTERDIRYFEENIDCIFKNCIDEIKAYLESLIGKKNYLKADCALIYVYFKSKNIPELEEVLEQLHQSIINYCLNC